MFTIKFYNNEQTRCVIKSAESFTILRDGEGAEITLHRKNPEDSERIDLLANEDKPRDAGWPPVYRKAIIENATGRTTEILNYCGPSERPSDE